MNYLLYDEEKWIDIKNTPIPTETPVWIKQDELRPVPAMYHSGDRMSGIISVKLENGELKFNPNEGYIKVTHWQPLINQ